MSLNSSDIDKIALLSRLNLTDSEKVQFNEELNTIFKMIEKMEGVDTSKVEPLSHPHQLFQRLREDIVTENSDEREKLQSVAPYVHDSLYIVPKVIN